MSFTLEHFKKLYPEWSEGELDLRRLIAQGEDNDGALSASLCDQLRFLAIGDLVIKGNRKGFVSRVREMLGARIGLYERFLNGENVASSFVGYSTFSDMLD